MKSILITSIIAVFVIGTVVTAYSEDMSKEQYVQSLEESINQQEQQLKIYQQEAEQNNIKPEQNNTGVSLPEWVRSVAGFWASGLITDDQFMSAIEYMINNKLITITNTTSETPTPIPPTNTPTLPQSGIATPDRYGATIDTCDQIGDYVLTTGRFKAEQKHSVVFLEYSLENANFRTVKTDGNITSVQSINKDETKPFMGIVKYTGTWSYCNVAVDSILPGPFLTPIPSNSDITTTSCGLDALGYAEARGTYTANANYDFVRIYMLLTDSEGKVIEYSPDLDIPENISKGDRIPINISLPYETLPFTKCEIVIGSYLPTG